MGKALPVKAEMMNILVCDDDREIVEAIDIYLTQEGYQVLKGCTRDGSQIYRKIINLPDGSTQKLYAKVQHGQVILPEMAAVLIFF